MNLTKLDRVIVTIAVAATVIALALLLPIAPKSEDLAPMLFPR